MPQINVHLGEPSDVAPVLVYEHSNLARRYDDWPSCSSRLAHVTAKFHDPASWLLIGGDGCRTVALAHSTSFRASGGNSFIIAERCGEGIGRLMRDVVMDAADTHGCRRICLWIHDDHLLISAKVA